MLRLGTQYYIKKLPYILSFFTLKRHPNRGPLNQWANRLHFYMIPFVLYTCIHTRNTSIYVCTCLENFWKNTEENVSPLHLRSEIGMWVNTSVAADISTSKHGQGGMFFLWLQKQKFQWLVLVLWLQRDRVWGIQFFYVNYSWHGISSGW